MDTPANLASSERDFAADVMTVLTGGKPVPNTTPSVILQDRSISFRTNQRKESIDYLVAVVKELGFTVEVQQWQQ